MTSCRSSAPAERSITSLEYGTRRKPVAFQVPLGGPELELRIAGAEVERARAARDEYDLPAEGLAGHSARL